MNRIIYTLIFFLLGYQSYGQISEHQMPDITQTRPGEVYYQQSLGYHTINPNITLSIPQFLPQGNQIWQLKYDVFNVKSRISLKIITEENRADFSFKYKLPVDITIFKEDHSSTTARTNLEVFYDHNIGTSFQQIDIAEYQDGYKLVVEPDPTGLAITSYDPSNPGSSTPLSGAQILAASQAVDLQASIVYEKIDFFDPTYRHDGNDIQVSLDPSSNHIKICWEPIYGAKVYDLEWTAVERLFTGWGWPRADFNANAARVTLESTCYEIPNVFEKVGLVFRVRAKGYTQNDFENIYTGLWSCSYPTGDCEDYSDVQAMFWSSKIDLASHEKDSLNWQVVTSYAENGKRKDVVTYMDGTMRSRQTVTAINSDHNVLVAETIYDHQGRPAIQTLPAPVHQDMHLKFRQNFNQNAAGRPYSKTDFDLDSGCDLNVRMMSDQSGSAHYYSSAFYNNLSPQEINLNPHLAYIPKAEGYPFVQTEYTADNTGRIARQGGAGPQYQLDAGHETKYFYGVPSQEELDMLFGANVGFANHYKKNMVVDPNGQVSISHMDAKGNTIATALAGKAPAGLEQLDSYAPIQLNVDLLKLQRKIKDRHELSAVYNLLVEDQADYAFDYSIIAAQFKDDCMSGSICYDCYYDLDISIVNNQCGDTVFSKSITLSEFLHPDSVNYTCNTTSISFQADTTVNLAIGSYSVNKTLRVNEAIADAYVEHYINDAQNNCTNKLEEFLLEELALVDTTDCSIDCDDLGPDPENNPAEQGWEEILCDSLPSTPCEVARQLMLSDFMPGGQYAGYGDNYEVSNYPLSILNTSNVFQHQTTYYNYQTVPYPLDQYASINDSLINPATLSVQQYIENYNEAWAALFLQYHPEICYLDRCEDILTSHEFDIQINAIETYQEALDNGCIDFNGSGLELFNIDTYRTLPLPNLAPQNIISAMQDQITNYRGQGLSILQIAIHTVFCPTTLDQDYLSNPSLLNDIPPPGYNALAEYNSCVANLSFANATDEQKDQLWATYKALYLAVKNDIEYVIRTAHAVAGGCYNECIGQDQFNPFVNGFSYLGSATDSEGNTILDLGYFDNAEQVCDTSYFALFKDKQKRFPSIYDLMPNMNVDYYDPDTEITEVWQNIIENTDQELMKGCDDCIDHDLLNGLIKHSWRPNVGLQELLQAYGNPEVSFQPNHILGINNHNSFTINDACSYYIYQDHSTRIAEVISIDPITTNIQFPSVSTEIDALDKPFLFSIIVVFENQVKDTLIGFSNCPIICEEDNVSTPSCHTLPEARDFLRFLNAFHWRQSAGTGIIAHQTSMHNIGQDLQVAIGIDTMTGQYPFTTNISMDSIIVSFYNGCQVTLNIGRQASQFGTNGIYQFGNIVPDYSQLNSDGFANHFSISYQNKDGQWSAATGYTSGCFHVGYCCPDIATAEPVTPSKPPIGTPRPLPPIKPIDTKAPKTNLNKPKTKKDQKSGLINLPDLDGITDLVHQALQQRKLDSLKLTEIQQRYCRPCGLEVIGGIWRDTIFGQPCIDIQCQDSIPVIYATDLTSDCIEQLYAVAVANAYNRYDQYIDSIKMDVKARYMAQCMNAKETFTGEFAYSQHHFTLYYYDQSNNLVQTVPPNGTVGLDATERQLMADYRDSLEIYKENIIAYQADNSLSLPSIPNRPVISAITESWASEYTYNSLNQLTEQEIPDQGFDYGNGFRKEPTVFWYDDLGRLVASQNPEQATSKKYSYTLYDGLGRIRETGEVERANDPDAGDGLPIQTGYYQNGQVLNAETSWTTFLSNPRSQITETTYDQPYYDNPPTGLVNVPMDHLRGRVAAAASYDTHSNMLSRSPEFITHYSYDIHGNVKNLVQQPKGFAAKTIAYDYDLISGNVNYVWYQRDKIDQFTHHYRYDADNRLTLVQTSRDGVIWEEDAHYKYYLHGPLARLELGEEEVQGLDYAYTLQGWIKGMNSAASRPGMDIGQDGVSGHRHENFARDEVGFTLNYNQGDYKPSGTNPFSFDSDWNTHTMSPQLWNGNIRSMITSIRAFMPDGKPAAYSYTYDQLNRIKSMNHHNNFDPQNNIWINAQASNNYSSSYTYDANGNILNLNRRGMDGTVTKDMDAFTYAYTSGNNRLRHLIDPVNASNFANDIDNQNLDNYTYDRLGNLTKDEAEDITHITWHLSGKVSEIEKSNGTKIKFHYDALGNRIAKIVNDTTTWYIRDASGNTMSTYESKRLSNSTISSVEYIRWETTDIYGSSRLGQYQPNKIIGGRLYAVPQNPISNTAPSERYRFTRGLDQYELTNHLVNVLATISDRKRIETDVNGESEYAVDVMSASDYYPFGLTLKKYSTAEYKFRFNGYSSIDEIIKNTLDFENRIYSSSLSKFISIDFDFKNYPAYSPYVFGINNGIKFQDTIGLGPADRIYLYVKLEASVIKTNDYAKIEKSFNGFAIKLQFKPPNASAEIWVWYDTKEKISGVDFKGKFSVIEIKYDIRKNGVQINSGTVNPGVEVSLGKSKNASIKNTMVSLEGNSKASKISLYADGQSKLKLSRNEYSLLDIDYKVKLPVGTLRMEYNSLYKQVTYEDVPLNLIVNGSVGIGYGNFDNTSVGEYEKQHDLIKR